MLSEDPRHEDETPLTKEQEDLDAKAALQARITVREDHIAPTIFRFYACLDDDCEPGRPVRSGRTPEEAIAALWEVLRG